VPADTVTLAASHGTVAPAGGGKWSWSYDGTDDLATTTVTITAADEDGGKTHVTFDLTVNNVAPTLTVDQATVTINEGQTAANSGSFGDVPADTVTLTTSQGVVVDNLDGTWSWSYDGADDETTTVTITATDDNGGVTNTTIDLKVNNVNPTVNAGADAEVNEGSSFIGIGLFTDPGADTWTAKVNYGDGSGDQPLTLNPDKTFVLNHTYADEGTYTVTVSVTDKDFGSHSDELVVTVANVDPVLSPLSISSAVINEDGTVTISGSFADTGIQDTHSVLIDWGGSEGTSAATVTQGTGGGSFTATHQYKDDDPTASLADLYTITATVTDDDGGSVSQTIDVAVNNVDPVIASLTLPTFADKGLEGSPIALSGLFTDIGTLDTHSAVVNWGDGSAPQSLSLTQAAGGGSISGVHTYAVGGIYTVTVTLTDDDGGADTLTSEAVITGAGLRPDGTLVIVGTSANDLVTINKQGNGLLKVHANFFPTGPFKTFNLDAVDLIMAYLCQGDDHMTIAGNVAIPAILYGQGGNDQLNAGAGPTVLLGGSGDDLLNGTGGRSILIGGTGRDRLVGGNGDDVLVGGSTSLDGDDDALLDLLDVWASSDPYEDRVADVAGLLADLDDGETDVLNGASGRDLFFDGLGDSLQGVKKSGKDLELVV
jgi:hypothetical protein